MSRLSILEEKCMESAKKVAEAIKSDDIIILSVSDRPRNISRADALFADSGTSELL